MKRFKKILCVSDLAKEDENAFQRAVSLAQLNKAKLTIYDVVENHSSSLKQMLKTKNDLVDEEQLCQEKEDFLNEKITHFKDRNFEINAQTGVGIKYIEIIKKVIHEEYDLVIMSREQQKKFKETFFGTNNMHLMRKCPCPVWVVKSSFNDSFKKIAAAIKIEDPMVMDSSLNMKILQLATSLADWDKAELNILYVWNIENQRFKERVEKIEFNEMKRFIQCEYEKEIEKLLDEVPDNNVKARISLIEGEPIIKIPELTQVEETDLLIMGTVSRTGIAGLLIGNTAEEILSQVECSVLTVKPDGFESPIK